MASQSSPYRAFKRCLIDAWPHSYAYMCAAMVMKDFGLLKLKPNGELCYPELLAFVSSFNMPSDLVGMKRVNKNPYNDSLHSQVAVYISAFYPKTSEALFSGASKDVAFGIFMKEKKTAPFKKRVFNELKAEDRKMRGVRTIKARSLDKRHDWNTVK